MTPYRVGAASRSVVCGPTSTAIESFFLDGVLVNKSAMYLDGQQNALAGYTIAEGGRLSVRELSTMRMGFQKLAFVDGLPGKKSPTRDDEDESHLGRNLAMAGAAASPWAGLIGQKPLLHAGKGPELEWEEFRKQMRPGDVILQGSPKKSLIKDFVGAATGQPQTYHTEVVGPKGTKLDSGPGFGMTQEAGAITRKDLLAEMNLTEADLPQLPPDMIQEMERRMQESSAPRGERLQILRPKLDPAERKTFLKNLQQGVSTSDTYNRELASVLKNQGHSPEAIEKMLRAGNGGTYTARSSVMGGLKELFLPKLTSPEAIEASKANTIAARTAFNKNEGGAATQAAEVGAKRLKNFKPLQKMPASKLLFQTHTAPTCVGSVCSSFPAQALPEGKNVIPGKLPEHLLAPDYLRSDLFEPVARFNPSPGMTSREKLLSHAPTLARLGAGALAATGVYGASKLWDHFHKKKTPPPDDQGDSPWFGRKA